MGLTKSVITVKGCFDSDLLTVYKSRSIRIRLMTFYLDLDDPDAAHPSKS